MRSSGQQIETRSQINWKVLRQLWPYLTEFKGRIAIALIFLVLAKVSTIIMPFILKMIVDGLSGEASVNAPAFSDTIPIWALTPIALVFAYGLFRFSTVVFGELRDTVFSRVTERTIRRTGLKVFKHLHALDVDFHLERRTGGLARDIDRGTNGISFIMRFMVFNIIPTLIEISLVVGILLTSYGAAFGVVTAGSIVLYIAFSVVVTNWRNKYVRAANEADSTSNTRAIDSLLNYETVKYFTNEDFEAQKYDRDLAQWEQAKQKNRLSLFVLNAGQALIISAAITALLYLAVTEVTQGNITVGDFVLINAFMMQLFMPLNFLGFVYREIRVALVNIEKMFDLLVREPLVVDAPNAGPLISADAEISFENVAFQYAANRQILKEISFTIKPRQMVAVVGSSGAGKSTIVKLLLRFYDPTSGKITIGNQNLTEIAQQSLRAQIGIVPQDTVLFNDSILENVRYGNPEASDEDVLLAIQMAHLDEFIKTLPEGTSTLVGERGLKLSGGEKQRVAIARALLKRPPIMIFDEATSSLDSKSERAILSAIEEIASHYTSLVIAHRLSTVINADKIIVLDAGLVVESGSHEELLARQGLYAELWQAQQKNQIANDSNREIDTETNKT
ncbi:ABC transporter ATP-binding protein/permease [Aliikangiella marina]|uniref:ABC transporter ATP-binding protein/permease n=1 Tax=Aliikangiella marina TaxID=1712262 RepID=A0A545TJP6_9GAMM|nr:ABC transporter ATP-binding protein/permease [Aliikangiella marina]TQV77442.1 ABC transporter ATP-binding protein/permease [Aliikangiella marina]